MTTEVASTRHGLDSRGEALTERLRRQNAPSPLGVPLPVGPS